MTDALSRYLALASLRAGIGRMGKLALLEALPLEAIWQRAEQDSLPGWTPKQCQQLLTPDPAMLEQALSWQESAPDRHIVTLADPRYPLPLKAIADPPLVLFVEGQDAVLSQPAVAMVGSRNAALNSLALARSWSAELAEAGVVVISGLAVGIDGACHEGALTQGQTLAVQGCGLSHCYPKRHRALADRIRQNGALISEYWPVQPVRAHQFPQRNRIVSGLSYGVIVLEAGLKSGSLITARLAAEQGREVFAVPGSVDDPRRSGCHWLIQQGAKLATRPVDILEELLPQWREPASKRAALTNTDLPDPALLDRVGYEITPVDCLVQACGLTVGEVLEQLTELELDGRIAAVPGGYVRLRGG
ncbi:DNA-processing protein DprA [Ferrimonas pelagia]|uniref:DNA-processing protein DprA n=1 Tax=Ferrimonas pelagia TaxID=1177826 RepID=A0ABP9F7W6_9GAMM